MLSNDTVRLRVFFDIKGGALQPSSVIFEGKTFRHELKWHQISSVAAGLIELCGWLKLRSLSKNLDQAPDTRHSPNNWTQKDDSELAHIQTYLLSYYERQRNGNSMRFSDILFPSETAKLLNLKCDLKLDEQALLHPLKLLFFKDGKRSLSFRDGLLRPENVSFALAGAEIDSEDLIKLRSILTSPAIPRKSNNRSRDRGNKGSRRFAEFGDARKVMLSEIEHRLRLHGKVSLRISSISGQYSWRDLVGRLAEVVRSVGGDLGVTVEMLVVNPRVLKRLNQIAFSKEANVTMEQYRHHAAKSAKQSPKINITLAVNDSLPHIHGVLIDEEVLFEGACTWNAEQELSTGTNPYRMISKGHGPADDDALNSFRRWFTAYWMLRRQIELANSRPQNRADRLKRD